MTNFFEKRVMDAVLPVLGKNDVAEFFATSGTLFVTCNVPTMSRVTRALSNLGVGNFKISAVGNEYAVDFI